MASSKYLSALIACCITLISAVGWYCVQVHDHAVHIVSCCADLAGVQALTGCDMSILRA